MVAGGSHFMLVEDPKLFAQNVLSFIQWPWCRESYHYINLLKWRLWKLFWDEVFDKFAGKLYTCSFFLGSFWFLQCSQLVTKSRGTKNQFPILQFGLIWLLQEFLVSGSLVTWESCWKQWHARPTWILKQLWFRGVCACVLRFRHGTLSNLPCSGASNQYDIHPAASRSPLFDTASAFAAVYVSIYLPLFEWGCDFWWQLHQSMPCFGSFGAFMILFVPPMEPSECCRHWTFNLTMWKLYQLRHGSSYSAPYNFELTFSQFLWLRRTNYWMATLPKWWDVHWQIVEKPLPMEKLLEKRTASWRRQLVTFSSTPLPTKITQPETRDWWIVCS